MLAVALMSWEPMDEPGGGFAGSVATHESPSGFAWTGRPSFFQSVFVGSNHSKVISGPHGCSWLEYRNVAVNSVSGLPWPGLTVRPVGAA
jgi:hypothetical protein